MKVCNKRQSLDDQDTTLLVWIETRLYPLHTHHIRKQESMPPHGVGP